MTFYERLQERIKEKGETIKSTEKKCGMANATIQKWQKQSPRLENIEKVATFLDISIDWLVKGEEQTERRLTAEEQELLTLYRRLDQKDRREVIGIIDLKLRQDERERKILGSKIG